MNNFASAPTTDLTNSYPNKWHKFLTRVLVRAVKRQQRCCERDQVSPSDTSTLQSYTRTLNDPGGKMAVAWWAPCPITAGMAHAWLGWNGTILWSCYNEMKKKVDRSLQPKKTTRLSFQPVLR